MSDEDSSLKDAAAQARLIDELGLKLNDKIEVRWLIEREGQPTESKWWGARLVESNAESKEVTLLYDAIDDFSETRNRVLFLSETFLYDVEEGDELPYRREGELIDTTDCEVAQADEVTFAELAEEQDETAAVVDEEMQKLPHSMQVQIADRFEQFKSGFIEFLREKTEERGPSAVIKQDDIEEFVSKMKQKDQKKN